MDKLDAVEESPKIHVPTNERFRVVTLGHRRIVGKWKVSNAAASLGRLPHAVFIEDLADIAIDVISGGQQDTSTFDLVTGIDIEFRDDGTCWLHTGPKKTDREGTWTLNGDTLIQSYGGKAGKPGTVAWESKVDRVFVGEPDKFTLVRPDRPTFTFVRAE